MHIRCKADTKKTPDSRFRWSGVLLLGWAILGSNQRRTRGVQVSNARVNRARSNWLKVGLQHLVPR